MTNDKRTTKPVIASVAKQTRTTRWIASAYRLAMTLAATLAMTVAALTLLASCSDDETAAEQPAPNAVSFTAGIGNTATPTTRTANGGEHWASGNGIGIFMLKEDGELTTPADLLADNIRYRATPGDPASTATFAPDNAAQTIEWPDAGSYDFIAYYLYIDNISGDYRREIGVTTQTNETRHNYADALYAKAKSQSQSGGAVALEFDHVMSKITLNVKAGGGVEASDIAAMTRTDVVFGNMPPFTYLNLQDGTLTTLITRADFSPFKPDIPAEGFDATFTAILVPQPQNGGTSGTPDFNGRTVTFTVGGTAYTWNIPDGQVFATGTHYAFTVTVNHNTGQNPIIVGDATIVPWTTVVSGTGEADPFIVQPEANSYMVAPGSDPILIPVSQANRVMTADALGADVTGLGGVTADNYTVELVWGDTPVGPGGVIRAMRPYKDGYIYVEPGPTAGNAIIAIRDTESGAVKWSWHIWVTPAVTSATDPATGLTWMDRNLGATANTPLIGGAFDPAQWAKTLGLYYQWGRKDAFPGSDGTIVSGYATLQNYYTDAGGNTPTNANPAWDSYTDLPDMVRNPFTFTIGSTYYGSLNVAGTDNRSWSGNSGEKTLYDPCPPGWKIPAYTVGGNPAWGDGGGNFGEATADWDAFKDYGTVFRSGSVNHYYPAAGLYYNDGNASLYGPGYNALYWSATPDVTYLAYRLGQYNPDATSDFAAARANGLTVRCVRE